MLALAQSRRATGAQLLASYIVGVEVACRLGDAVDPSHYLDGFHPTGTLGTFGAAAACAHLLKLKPISIRHALGIAGTMAAGLRANRGTMAKGLNAGRAAESGVIAATLAAEGFTASENIFDDPMGFFHAACRNRVDRNLLRFGKPFFFASPGVSIKLYPCAGVLHPAVDVVLDLRRRYAIAAERVERIKVTVDADAALPLVYDRPKDALQAKFSAHFAVAAALIDGAAGLKQFSAERVRDPKIRNLMKRVELIRRPMRKRTNHTGIDTDVEIAMKDGAIHRGHAVIARGHPALPPSRAEIAEKFRYCADGILPPARIARFLQHFDTLERAASVTAWLQALCPPPRQGLVKVVWSRIKNPSKSPFTKGDFQFPPLKKGARGILDNMGRVKTNKRSHFAAGVLTPALIKISQRGCSPPLESPFNGSTLKSAWSTTNSLR